MSLTNDDFIKYMLADFTDTSNKENYVYVYDYDHPKYHS